MVAHAVAAVAFFAGFLSELRDWAVGHFLWLQDQGLTTIDFHNQIYEMDVGGGVVMILATVGAYGFALGLLIWLLRRAASSDPRLPDVTAPAKPRVPEGHGYAGIRVKGGQGYDPSLGGGGSAH